MMAITHDQNKIRQKLMGEDLDEIWWQGRQWAVTSYGIERRDGIYAIEASTLWQRTPIWPDHMSWKATVDLDDFCTAFLVGLSLHPRPADAAGFAPDQLREICDLAISGRDRLIAEGRDARIPI
jgi:hypothetical protein